MGFRQIDTDIDIILALARARQNACRSDVSHDIEMIRQNMKALGTSPASYGTSFLELERLELEGLENEVKRLTKLEEGGMNCQDRIKDTKARISERKSQDLPENVIILFPLAD